MDLNILLKKIINDAISIGFQVSPNLRTEVYIDDKRLDRVGACYRYIFPEKYEIHLSKDVLRAKEHDLKSIIAHEVLHANIFTMEHNYIWEAYKNLMNDKFGYNIKVRYSWHEILR